MAALKDKYNIGDDSWIQFNNMEQAAQIITPTSEYSVPFIRLKMFRIDLPGIITASYKVIVFDKPSGTDLCTGTIDGNSLTTNTTGEWKQINFDIPIVLNSGIKYAIVIKAQNPAGCWRIDASSPTYTGGTLCLSYDGGLFWTIVGSADAMVGSADAMFENYGESIAETLARIEQKISGILQAKIIAPVDSKTITQTG